MPDDDKPVVVVSSAKELKGLVGAAPEADAEAETPRVSITEHEVTIAGQRVPYTATCGTLEVSVDDPDKPRERLFYTAYVRSDVEDLAKRPLTFCFNGGPGSASVWLHMGCFGPRRVRVDVDAQPRPPGRAEDHDRSLLDVTDLVFIDPLGTGFSRPSAGKGEDYYSVDGDVKSVAEFVRRYVTTERRWASPKYVAGESYGTTRAAALANHLQDRYGLYLNGLVLLSTALQFQCFVFAEGNDLPYALFLPGYAATAAYHGRVHPDDVGAFVAAAEAFAMDRYVPALVRGSRLSEAERREVAEQVAHFTGLSVAYVMQNNLRVPQQRFCRELLRDDRRTVGRLDSRFVGPEADGAGESMNHDPSLAALNGIYASAFLHDVRTRLGYVDDEVYELLNLEINQGWTFPPQHGFLDVTPRLRDAMHSNPHLRVLAVSGLYDLATPAFATDYTLAHLGIDETLKDSVRHAVYPAGHMMYAHEPSMDRLRDDLVAFYTEG